MNRLVSIIALCPLFLGGTGFAQSVEPPSLSALGEAIASAVSDALSNTAADLPGGPGFLDPETGDDDTLGPETGNPRAGDDDTLNPETGNDTERRRPLDIVVIAGDPPDEIQGHTIVCKPLQAGGNPLEGLNVSKGGPKPKKTMECKVVGK